ncbi:zinc finger protein 785-like [Tribolium madens]|uniref:zinc finger protein 785-like n=1 Tax=Tribolium madens TaxID=41895 RepID=UPI001CF73320|nr:zinc finger protein 785-like [Tribolium madens]
MEFSGIWNQILINPTTVCFQPNPLIEGIQVITPYVTSSDTSSSINSESSVAIQEEDEVDEEINSPEDDEKGEKDVEQKKAIQRVRYSKEEYRCKQCPYTCTTEKAFLHHLRWCEDKSTKKLLSCPVCGKDRRSEETLSIHMMKHKQDKYFCCDICKFKTIQLKKLIQHRRMHTGEKPHLCPFCSYRSSRRDNLRSHVRRVHKKQDLPCDTFTPRSMVLSPRKPISN